MRRVIIEVIHSYQIMGKKNISIKTQEKEFQAKIEITKALKDKILKAMKLKKKS